MKLVEVEKSIAEKEIILTLLLEQVKGFSAMKVWRTIIYMFVHTIFKNSTNERSLTGLYPNLYSLVSY